MKFSCSGCLCPPMVVGCKDSARIAPLQPKHLWGGPHNLGLKDGIPFGLTASDKMCFERDRVHFSGPVHMLVQGLGYVTFSSWLCPSLS
jgi:hypothetical protein